MSIKSYREQRQKISSEELAKHAGKWAAFSRDGTCIVASSKKLETLEKKLVEAGHDPQDVVYEFLGTEDFVLGGAEFL